jgi:hypothetical protein
MTLSFVVNRQQETLVFLSNVEQLYKLSSLDHKNMNLKQKFK